MTNPIKDFRFKALPIEETDPQSWQLLGFYYQFVSKTKAVSVEEVLKQINIYVEGFKDEYTDEEGNLEQFTEKEVLYALTTSVTYGWIDIELSEEK